MPIPAFFVTGFTSLDFSDVFRANTLLSEIQTGFAGIMESPIDSVTLIFAHMNCF